MLLAAVIGALIGLALGTLGGGGSILTVPALVYLLGQDPHGAAGSSLMIVGTNALLGAWLHRRAGHVRLGAAVMFGAAGIAAAYGGARLSRLLPGPALLVLFALLMIVIAGLMLHGKASETMDWKTLDYPNQSCCYDSTPFQHCVFVTNSKLP
jgi:uncharacterized protein